MAERREHTSTEVSVTHIAAPLGRERENGPHLTDLRQFVDECEGLPGDLRVSISNGHMGESGRYDVTLKVRQVLPGIGPEREDDQQ
jgi:hypothetical protein